MNNLRKNDKSFKWKNQRRPMTKQGIVASFQYNREYTLAKDQYTATDYDNFLALAISLRDRIVERWIKTQQEYHKENVKRVYYLSLEFLIGRLLENYVINLGMEKPAEEALKEMGFELDDIAEQELDAGLGNGGLGRLAACFLESMATLGIPAHGYGIRYDYGIFHQKIVNGYQLETPDEWLRNGCPWEFARPEYTVTIRFYGRVESYKDVEGNDVFKWVDTEDVLAVPYDIPVVGHKNNVVNTLRLWSAKSTEQFDLSYFNDGDYEQAVYKKIFSENISKVLYPNDSLSQGRELRLKQEYFSAASSIADILRRFKGENEDLTQLPEKAVIQLNDTHPALAVVELMRVLIDQNDIDFKKAWDITKKVFAYTNHTLLPEALECWPVELLEKVLPRHMQLIYQINQVFIDEVKKKVPNDGAFLQRVSLIDEHPVKRVRMAHLAIIGSHSVNGVSALHSELLKKNLFADFHALYPKKFNNKTNGITQRVWLLQANPTLSTIITDSIGEDWAHDLSRVKKIEKFKDDARFIEKWQKSKLQNKEALSEYISKALNISVDPTSMFDIQVKRMHEYKRQLLFALYIFSQYLRIKSNPHAFVQPRTFIIGGKAAPGYQMAKLIIKFINNIADLINGDEAVRAKIKLIFLENYRVSLAEKIIPACNLSEQISTAGMEASGTGNMKFMLNGALTIGTLDGANIEIAENVGEDNIFIFGLKAHEVEKMKTEGYDPRFFIEQSHQLKEIYSLLLKNYLCPNQKGLFDPIVKSVFHHDPYMVCADFDAYCKTQEEVERQYADQELWTKKSIINVANSGAFSSDRTIREYAKDIWNVPVN